MLLVGVAGRYRIVEASLMDKTADALLGAIVEHDMPLDKVLQPGVAAQTPFALESGPVAPISSALATNGSTSVHVGMPACTPDSRLRRRRHVRLYPVAAGVIAKPSLLLLVPRRSPTPG